MSAVSNPIFARVYARVSAKTEKAGQAEHRRELLEGLSGRVVEVGAGHGVNFAHYPATVEEVIAVEPEPFLRARAQEAAARAEVSVRVVDGVADELPLDTGSMDAGAASLVLCTVPDPRRALAELHRVIRPGGELRFYEHVLGDRPGYARFQQAVTKVWPFFAGGCHPNREPGDAIARAGFIIERQRRFTFRPFVIEAPVAPRILGVARRP